MQPLLAGWLETEGAHAHRRLSILRSLALAQLLGEAWRILQLICGFQGTLQASSVSSASIRVGSLRRLHRQSDCVRGAASKAAGANGGKSVEASPGDLPQATAPASK